MKSLQQKQSLNYLIYGALVEIMLDTYSNTHLLTYFDHTLLTKHKNLIPSWERESKKIQDYMYAAKNEAVIQQYYDLINVLEALVESTREIGKFTDLLQIIKEWNDGNLEIVEK